MEWITLEDFVELLGSVEAAEKRIRDSELQETDPKKMGNGISVEIMMGRSIENGSVDTDWSFLWNSRLEMDQREVVYIGEQNLNSGSDIMIRIPRTNWDMIRIMFV